MPFELTNALATFKRWMNEVFKEHLRKFISFLYDILAYSPHLESFCNHLYIVLDYSNKNYMLSGLNVLLGNLRWNVWVITY